MKYTQVVLVVIFCVICSVFADNFNNGIVQLPKFQDQTSGAFRATITGEVSLAATADALFLTELYGLKTKINPMFINEYIETLRKGNSYAEVGQQPDMEATLNAVLSYKYLGEITPNIDGVQNWIVSLYDGTLFASFPQSRGNIKSTYEAVTALAALDSLSALPLAVRSNVVDAIKGAYSNAGSFDFPGVPTVQATFYSVSVLNTLGEDLEEFSEAGEVLLNLQRSSGGFSASFSDPAPSFEATFSAVAALELLDADLLARVNVAPLYYYCRSVPLTVNQVALSHKAISYTPAFAELFKFYVEYGFTSRNNKVVQGSLLKPELVARGFGGPSHPGLQVSVTSLIEGGSPRTLELEWDARAQKYVSDTEISTDGLLGPITFQYTMNLQVFGIGAISFSHKSDKFIGYSLQVAPDVSHVTGKLINEGDSVSAGTTFNFNVRLSNTTANFKSGDFDLRMVIQDSSGATLYTQSVDGRTNTNPFTFSYNLEEANYPPGEFNFYFLVAGANGRVHTSELLSYELTSPMVATDIKFNGEVRRNYQLGETLNVEIRPAILADFKPNPLIAYDNEGVSVAEQRALFMDITTSTGAVLESIPGVAEDNTYVFEYDIPVTFDSIGSSVLVFRYVSKSGKVNVLDNFDSEEDALFDEPLRLVVETDLHATILEQPSTTNLYYGNEVRFVFDVEDRKSNQNILPGKRGGAFLSLTHYDQASNKLFSSAKQVAKLVEDNLVVSWEINPNAISGKSFMNLVAESPDGSEVPLQVNGKPYSLEVNIGGDIDEVHQVFSTSDLFTLKTVFLVQFSLSCNDVPLRDVRLRGVVSYNGQRIDTVAVGVSDDHYVTSWGTDHMDSPSGTYTIEFFREADQQRAAEAEEWRQKQIRAKQREAELTGSTFDEAEFLASNSVNVAPLFTVSIPHSEVAHSIIPVRAEVVLGLVIIVSWLYFDHIKTKYNQLK